MHKADKNAGLMSGKRKGQGLPITTVVLLAIAVVGLAVILIFLFLSQSSSSQSTGTFFNLSINQSADACASTLAFGGCPANNCCSMQTGKCKPCTGTCPASGKC